MKTIFIPIPARQQARNILRTDILKKLQAERNVRVVIFASHIKLEQYKKECTSSNTYFEAVDIPQKSFSALDTFFYRLSLSYINSGTARFLREQWLLHERRAPIRYGLSLLLLYTFGSFRFLQKALRSLDLALIKDRRLEHYFEAYTPDLVFVSKISPALDCAFLRHAKKQGIKTAGMISAWDNITIAKYPFRFLPDTLIAYNETIKKEAVTYLGMRENAVHVTGMPHFDFYTTHTRAKRDEFCARLGIDPQKRIILFSSVGKVSNPTEWQTLTQMVRACEFGMLPDDIIIIFRQHPTEKIALEHIPDSPFVVVDDSKTTFLNEEESFSEILTQDMEHLADSLYHARLLVTPASTMSIDAATFDTPIINIAYDGWEERPFHLSVRRKFTPRHTHYQPIVKSGGVRIVRSEKDLIRAINDYLEDPAKDQEGRKRIVREQCYKLDGKSGERIGSLILQQL